MSSTPDVSVIIPTYNRLAYLKQAIASCFDGNDGIEFEVIVVDDGSSDGTREWLRAANDPGVRPIFQEHTGPQVARNRGLAAARGEYVKFLDDDDWLARDALENQAHVLAHEEARARGNRASVFGDVMVVGPDGQQRRLRYRRIANRGVPRVLDLLTSSPITLAPLHQREAVREVGGFDERLDDAHDYDLHLRLGLDGVHLVHYPSLVGFYRNHAHHRVSTGPRDGQWIDNAIDRIEARYRLLEDAIGSPLPAEVAGVIAKQFWHIGREAARAGRRKEATACFRQASVVYPASHVPGSTKYRMLAGVAGGYGAERLLRMLGR